MVDFRLWRVLLDAKADERFVGVRLVDEGESMVRVPPVEEMFLQESSTKERTKYYPSQSAKSLVK